MGIVKQNGVKKTKQNTKLKTFTSAQRTASSAGNIEQKHENQNITAEEKIYLRKYLMQKKWSHVPLKTGLR